MSGLLKSDAGESQQNNINPLLCCSLMHPDCRVNQEQQAVQIQFVVGHKATGFAGPFDEQRLFQKSQAGIAGMNFLTIHVKPALA
jgi:hypothetical protein